MKKVLITAVLAMFFSAPLSAGLLKNSSFTGKKDDGKPSDWKHSVGLDKTQAEIKVWGTTRGQDTSCLRASTAKLDKKLVEEFKRSVPIVEQKVQVQPGKTYTLSIWTRCDYGGEGDEGNMRFQIRADGFVQSKAGDDLETTATPLGRAVGTGDRKLVPFVASETFEHTGQEWKQYEITFTVPKDGWLGELKVKVSVMWRGVVYFDDFELKPVGGGEESAKPAQAAETKPEEGGKPTKSKVSAGSGDAEENDDAIGLLMGHHKKKKKETDKRKEYEEQKKRQKAHEEAMKKKIPEQKDQPKKQSKAEEEENTDTIQEMLGHGKRNDR